MNTERRGIIKGVWVLVLGVAAGGFGYTLGFQQGHADGSNGAEARFDLITSRLEQSRQRALAEEARLEDYEPAPRRPAAKGSERGR